MTDFDAEDTSANNSALREDEDKMATVAVCAQPWQHRQDTARRWRVRSAPAASGYGRPGTAKLAGVKHEMYHPGLPSLRRMDMDEVAHRLPTEHSRLTTALTLQSFKESRSTWYQPAVRLPCKRITTTGHELEDKLAHLSRSLPTSPIDWDSMLEKRSEKAKQPVEMPASGFTSRYLSPEVTQKWRYTLRQLPQINRQTRSQQPLAASLQGGYREQVPSYSQRVVYSPWR